MIFTAEPMNIMEDVARDGKEDVYEKGSNGGAGSKCITM